MIFFIIFPFLALGCLAFLLCAAVPPLRKYALGLALWCVACVPCLFVILLLVLLLTVGANAVTKVFNSGLGVFAHSHQTWIGWFLSLIMLIVVLGGATAITALHGIILRRFTLALFSSYLAAVSFGVVVLTVFFLSLLIAGQMSVTTSFWLPVLLTNALSLPAAPTLAYICYRNAPQFRGKYPDRFPIVTKEEFS